MSDTPIHLHNFCGHCGKPTNRVPTGGFNRATGEPLMRAVCPEIDCRHDGHSHKWEKSYLGEAAGMPDFGVGGLACKYCGVFHEAYLRGDCP